MNFPLLAILLSIAAIAQIEALRPNPSLSSLNLSKTLGNIHADQNEIENNIGRQQNLIHRKDTLSVIHNIRGGDVEEKDATKSFPMKVISMVSNTIFGSVFAVSRAIEAGLDALQEEGVNPVMKIFNSMSCMVKATFDKNYVPLGKAAYSKKDFSTFLCKAYGVPILDDNEGRVKIRAGSLSEALAKARSQARLLVVFIPSSKPKKRKNDQMALQSLISPNVYEIAEQKARKKGETASFMFWSTKHDSAEAVSAIKRLKAKKGSNNGKNPVLMVIYPSQSMNSSGQVKVAPRVLAQHHCNPPPSAESMSAWLNALRKRHAKQYANMQHELKELELLKERTEGYKSSMEDDKKRENEDRIKEKEKLEEEKAKREREEEIRQRRASLLEALPEEPDRGAEGTITIALRFDDGRKGQRRFEGETGINELFNWVDALFEVERELVTLTTMKGQRSFTYGEDEELTLEDAALGKMVALRVSVKTMEDAEENDSDTDSDSDEDSDED